ncbi:MAG: 3TM-type holin [Holosporales bacterium]|jgi:hypothetical protein
MLTLLGSLLGFFGSLVPEILKLLQTSRDRAHELEILKLQLEQQQLASNNRLEEIRIGNAAVEAVALYKTYATGIAWVDALNGTVRPVIAYAFFALYAALKMIQPDPALLWSEEDSALFAGIISFYFGQRALQKQQR